MTITHITEREQALRRENERYLKTINIQAVTIEAQQEELAKLRAEIAALKAQPVQEPIGWIPTQYLPNLRIKGEWVAAWANPGGSAATPIYTAPAQPAPLTDAQIFELVEGADLDWHKGWSFDGTDEVQRNRFVDLARAIEAAIKGGAT